MKYYGDTSNGLVYEKDAKGRELVLFVELSKDVDVVGGLLQGWIATGVTRCVRAVGVESDWSMDGLVKIAERKNRKVEKVVDGQNAGGVSGSQPTSVPSSLSPAVGSLTRNHGRHAPWCSASAKSTTQCSSKALCPGMRNGSTAISITPQIRKSTQQTFTSFYSSGSRIED